jgi:Cu/Ag efflux pump CusA
VVVYFEPGTDLYRARQMVTERMSQAAVGIPHVSKPPTMIQPLSAQSRFMVVGLSSEELSLIEMSVLARWTIAPQLMGVPGGPRAIREQGSTFGAVDPAILGSGVHPGRPPVMPWVRLVLP